MKVLSIDASRNVDSVPFRSADPGTVAGKPRHGGLERLRVMATLGVVLLHACVPYLKHPMPGLAWPVRDTPSEWLDVTFWAIEVFIMPVFLVMTGMFAWQTLQRRGAADLMRTRLSRLGKPFLFGMMVILPAELYIWVGGWVYEGWVDAVKLKSLKIDGALGNSLWGTSHLWFLLYVLSYVGIVAGIATWMQRNPAEKRYRFIQQPFGSRVALILLAGIGICTLCFRPEVVWGFQHDFLPVPSKWIYSGTFFLGGMWIVSQDKRLHRIQTLTRPLVITAVMSLGAAVAVGRWHLAGHQPDTAMSQASGILLGTTTTLAAWAVSLAAIGFFQAQERPISKKTQYVAAASFWIYLVHHPLLGLMHIDTKFLLPQVPSLVKGVFCFLAALSVSLLTYEAVVRQSALGRWLGMTWSPKTETSGTDNADPVILKHLETAATPRRRAA
ncbi:acyltransferase family protein [Crateriforma conspicua]|uniref:acyltransferase family protein n=1 Tax=Crateriforma conspicua TaxID=2527996 RepID=UPI0011A7BF14|nr:acyltransferase family protein [Crateriforma conspicua]